MIRWFYYVARFTVIVLLRLFTRWQIKGLENVPSQGALLMVANHLHLIDPPLVSVSLKRRAIFMAKEELFRSRFYGYFIGSFGAFPVHRGQLDRKAIRQAERVLAEGFILVMFPEASRSRKAQLQPAYPGSALIALRNGVPIVPVAITGTEKIKGTSWILHRPRVIINFGRPFHLPATNNKLSRLELTDSTNTIMEHIAELLPVEYRGHYLESGGPDVAEG
jgi:1-acyl-sn-glycerol-3-phosphate acyltransferase